jgi:flagellar basal-body rod protein FlgF
MTIPPHRKISIAADGTIEIEPLNAPIGQKLKIGQLATISGSEVPLTKSEDGFVRTVDGSVPEPDNKTRLLTGFLEGSNVKTVDELVSGIEQSRAYEINVKFVTTAKEIDEATASLMRMPS